MQLDLIISAKEIITLNPARPVAQSVGVLHGRIVGFDEEIAGLAAKQTLNYPAATVTPGLIDAHCHTSWWGLGLAAIDLSTARGLDELYSRIRSEVARLDAAGEDDAWVHGTGFNQSHHGGQYPDIRVLDEITGKHPLYLRHTSGHAAITNTTTLGMLGALAPGFQNPVGGEIVRDSAGNPTGLVNEAAQGLVQALLLPYSSKRLVAALDAATSRYAAEGITSFCEAGVGGGWIAHSPVEVTAYQDAVRQGKLHARAQLLPTLDALQEISGHAKDFHGEGAALGIHMGVGSGFGTDMVRFGHVKVFMDGSLLGSTAAVTEDFCGHHNHGNKGYLLDTPENYERRVLAAYRAGWPLALHAIGDAAVDLALDLLTAAQDRYGKPQRDSAGNQIPNRIEHFGIARPEQIVRAAELGIAVTPQARFISVFGQQMADTVGPERAEWLYRGRSLVDAGVIVAGSSDLPVVDNNMRWSMQSAVERVTETGTVLAPAERLTPLEALQTHTEWAARASGQLDQKGTLAAGKLADFTVFSGSPLTAPHISELQVLATVLGGELSYSA